jgi:hypothetical protein
MPNFWSASTTQDVLALAGSIFGSFSGLVVFAVGLGLALLILGFIVDRFL